ncbi:MAG: signal recognition particle-docking protein FtsY [Clostridiales bacterium]|nr:signal recognition particle-docking protein FtsY [Clostridiales bacterium]
MGEEKEKKGFFSRLKAGLTKTRDNIVHGIDSVFSGFSAIDEDFYEELEEILIMGDIGVNATNSIIEKLREQVKANHIRQPSECKEFLIKSIKEQMRVGETAYEFEHKQSVILVIGVNGVGKTTTVGKLAGILKGQGRKVLLAAADTFRAAAADQLTVWAERAGVRIVKHAEGADPGAVVYDAIASAKSKKTDVLLIDTAGRLHNKKNLMDELKKISRIIEREYPDCLYLNYIVLDATTGQNALSQVDIFDEAIDIDGIILTKLDGTAKGGVVLAIADRLEVPVVYVGVGESIDDLEDFDARAFIDAIIE